MNDIPDIATAVVTASYNNGQTSAVSDVLTITPATISLNFMRYTLALNSRKKHFSWPQKEQAPTYNPQGAPEVNGYSYRTTTLREGYLYLCIHNSGSERIFKEFKVGLDGSLTNIVSDLTEDHRSPKEINSQKYYLVKDDDVVWMAFSEYQWSAAFIKGIRNKEEARKQHMQKFDAAGWKASQTAQDACTVDEIDAYFPLDDEDTPPEQMEDGRWTPGTLKDTMDYGYIQWWKMHYDNVQVIDQDPDNKLEVFVCLHDPTGCAQVLADDLSEGVFLFKALVEAIQTGAPQKEIYESLCKGQQLNYTPDPEFVSLTRLALTCYQLVYNDEENTEKYDGGDPGWNLFEGYGLDKRKVEGILGVAERKEYKAELNKRRNRLGNFVYNEYLANTLRIYLSHNPEGTLSGIVRMFDFMRVLFINPDEIDIALLLTKDKPPKLDKWQNCVIDMLEGKTEIAIINDLLSKDWDIDKAYTDFVNLSNKLAGYSNAKLSFLAKQAFSTREFDGKVYTNIKSTQEIIVSRMNKVKAFGKEMYQFSDGQIELRLDRFGAELDESVVKVGKYNGPKTGVVRIEKDSEGFKIVSSKKGKHVIELAVEKPGAELTPMQQKLNKVNHKAGKLLNSTSFTGTVAFLQILNMQAAIRSLIEEDSNKNKLSLFGITADLTEASLKFYVAYRKSIGKELEKQISRSLLNKANIAGAIGGGITAVISFWDSIEAKNRADSDAALAYAGAGVAYSSATAYAVYCIAAKVTPTGPLGMILAGIGLGLTAAAVYLTDTPAETYFKNILLSDRKALLKQSSESPMHYSRRILKAKKALVKKPYHHNLMEPFDAEASLFDLIVCRQVYFKGDVNIKTSRTKKGGTYTVNRFNLEIDFYRILESPQQLKYDLYFFRYGIKNSTTRYRLTKKDDHKISIDFKEKGIRRLKLSFPIIDPWKKKMNDDSELLIVFRLNLDEDKREHFPYDLTTEKNRYMAAKTLLKMDNPIGLFDGLKALQIGNTKSQVITGTKNFVLNHKNW